MNKSVVVTKVLQTYWRTMRALTLGAQGCALTNDGKVLLIKHTYRPGWHFPGGGVEKNETVLTALSRELKEEANIAFEVRPRLFSIYANFQHFPSDHIALFVLREWRQTSQPVPNKEICDHGLFPVDDLPADIHGPTKARIEEILHDRPPAEIW